MYSIGLLYYARPRPIYISRPIIPILPTILEYTDNVFIFYNFAVSHKKKSLKVVCTAQPENW